MQPEIEREKEKDLYVCVGVGSRMGTNQQTSGGQPQLQKFCESTSGQSKDVDCLNFWPEIVPIKTWPFLSSLASHPYSMRALI